ncbi:MAG: hypothetical protein XU15_C0011G0157 [candidate division NC10 bacterium CSP1-5]|nr:MAG: hypothetical protein XU15_C0011G0013 [candidate division NC10 bacterium CSP1-5]KRT69475.1 MAG: hypothetical protein XU15_C0011G0157 [candidate division NC10 bacterium CSP1-5]
MARDKRKCVGMINGVPLFQDDINFTRKKIRDYREEVKRYARMARKARPEQRGGYMARVNRAERDIQRMKDSLAILRARVGKWDLD